MRWVFISPHFDDVVLSCGGLVWQLVQSGQAVEIWTICAAEPPSSLVFSPFAQSLHDRWGTGAEAVIARKMEDQAAGHRLGAALQYGDLFDCIYRKVTPETWLVNGEEDLWKPLPPQQFETAQRLGAWVSARLRAGDELVIPVSLGNHIDHQLVRMAVERLHYPMLWYYADYPYVARQGKQDEKMSASWEEVCYPVSETALQAWQSAIACHTSQISTFWGSLQEMEAEIRRYWQSGGGTCLYREQNRLG